MHSEMWFRNDTKYLKAETYTGTPGAMMFGSDTLPTYLLIFAEGGGKKCEI